MFHAIAADHIFLPLKILVVSAYPNITVNHGKLPILMLFGLKVIFMSNTNKNLLSYYTPKGDLLNRPFQNLR